MKFNETKIRGCFVIEPNLIEDYRGVFFRSYCEDEFKEQIGEINFVQMNHSINYKMGTFRGMHYQKPPYSEEKLIRCVKGKVLDFFLDLRKGSPTFLEYSHVELSEENRNMVFICKGVAHGFLTLSDNSDLIYHHTENYNKEADRGIWFNDPRVQMNIPFDINVISEKDKNYPLLTNEFMGVDI